MTVEPQVEPTQEMPEEAKPSQEPVKEPTIEEVLAQAKKDLEDKYKNEIAGLNRKVSEVTKELDAEKKAKMTEDERVKTELEEARQAAEQARREAEEYRRTTLVDKTLSENGLPLEFANRVRGETPEEIAADVQSLKSYIDNQVKTISESEVNKRLGGKAPESGAPPQEKLTLEEIDKLPYAERVKRLKELGYR